MLTVRLPDGSSHEFPDHATGLDVAAKISPRLASAALGVQVGTVISDVMRPLAEITDERPIPVQILTEKDPAALGILRHSCAHVMARAVMRLFPGVELAFGPTTGHGFYYDMALPHAISEDDFPRIEAEMTAALDKMGVPPGDLMKRVDAVMTDPALPSGSDRVHAAAEAYDPDGKFLEQIDIPEGPANLCFGGEDGKTLFITARTSLYSIRVVNAGAGLQGAK